MEPDLSYQQRFHDFERKEPQKVYTKRVDGQEVEYKEGVFWLQKQRQLHSLHYVSPYQASFPPQIPAYFVEHYSEKGDVVLDPFCGRGTTLLESRLRGRHGVGFDVSPLALSLAQAKQNPVKLGQVEERLEEFDFSEERLEGYDEFEDIYHPHTYSQILNIREQLGRSPVDNLIRAVIMGRLHGHSPGFFSVLTFNVISLSPDAIRKQNEKHDTEPEKRDIVPRILKKAKNALKDRDTAEVPSMIGEADSRHLPMQSDSADLIVTSPPFLAQVNYVDDNWLRLWFLGYDEAAREELKKTLVQTDDLDEYREFLRGSMEEMRRVIKPGKPCIIEVGDVAHRSNTLNLEEVVIELSGDAGLDVKEVLINHISSPKISKAFSEEAKEKGTKTNRCVIMEKA